MEYSDKELEYLKKMASSSKQGLANKCACICSTVLLAIISVAYLAEVLKGSRTIGYVAVVVVVCVATMIASWFFYNQNHSAPNSVMRAI